MTDTQLFSYLSRRYGVQLAPRFEKLAEEYSELAEAVARYMNEPSVVNHVDMVDELADVNIIIYHIAGLLSLTQRDLLNIAEDKIRRREINPNYKRKNKKNMLVKFKTYGGEVIYINPAHVVCVMSSSPYDRPGVVGTVKLIDLRSVTLDATPDEVARALNAAKP